MILNSGRHTQPDPQSCRVRSLGGPTEGEPKNKQRIKRPKQNWAVQRPIVKTIHCQRKHRKKHPASNVAAESAPHPRHVESLRQQHPNNSKQHGALAKIGNMQAGLDGLETFNQQPCSPESCHSVTLACFLLKLRHFLQKRSLQQSHFRGRFKHICFFGLQEVVLPSCVESLLLKQNPTLIYMRNVKSFVFRAGRKVPHCQKWNCHALPLFALDRAISRLFSISIFNSRRDQKRALQIHALERVAILFLGLRHDARKAPSCFKSSPETTKGRKDDTNIHVLNWGGPPLGVQILYTFPTP